MKRLKIILQSNLFYLLLFIICFMYVVLFTVVIKYESNYSDESFLSGVVKEKKIDGDKVSITIQSDKEKVIGTYYLKSLDEKNYYINNLKYGSSVKLVGYFSDPNGSSIFNTFDYKKYLYNKRIYKVFNISKIDIDNNNISFLDCMKNNLSDLISKRDNSEYIRTFVLGDKSEIDNNELNSFKSLGVSHLFAISGMHITLFSGVILFLFSKLKNKNIPIILSLVILFIYGLLCSFPSSIKRAYILYFLLSLNKIFKLNIKTMYLLYLTIVINIFIDCFIIYDIGFLYSSFTTYGLIKFSKFLKGNYLLALFKVSFVAFLFSLPLTISSNYFINILSPINNIFIVPLVSLIIYPLSLLTLLMPIFNPLFSLSLSVLMFIDSLLLKINVFNVVVPKIPIIIWVIYYLLLLFSYKNKKILIFNILIISIMKFSYVFDSNYYVYFFDVKQGDSALIVSPNHSVVSFIDTGGVIKYKDAKWKEKNNDYHLSDNIITFLYSIGIDKIDNLIISHGDYDHMGEAINLVNNFKVEKVIFNCGPYNDLEKELIKVLNKKKIPYYSCIKELNIDKNKLYFLQTKEYDNENDNSNVFYTELNGYKFMFMGDAGVEKEKDIIDKYNLSNVDVIKVGHHGSKTSSSKEFINKVNPKYSIISVGKNNRYGHPNKEVLDNLKDSKIYRTDQDGSILFKIQNNKLKIETCSP